MIDDPLFYSDPDLPNPLIRVDFGWCDEFHIIRRAIVAGTMTLVDSSDHVKTCDRCHNYLTFLKFGPPNPTIEGE